VVEQVGPVDAAALEGGEVLLSHNLARTLNLHAGDVITLPAAKGPRPLKVRAVVEDYSSEVGSLFMDWKVYAQLFEDPQVDAFMLYLRPGADPESVRTRIMARYGEGRNLNVVTHAAFKRFVEEVVDDAFAATRALQLVAVLIALMGIINTLLAAVLDRQREIGVLRAVGATRGQVITILTTEAVLLGLCSALLAVGVGLAFGAVFTTAVADTATGWQLPFKIPVQAVAESFLVALAVAAVAAAAPARRAAHVDVLYAMREE
jgi:putative ABC transport system permease protein